MVPWKDLQQYVIHDTTNSEGKIPIDLKTIRVIIIVPIIVICKEFRELMFFGNLKYE